MTDKELESASSVAEPIAPSVGEVSSVAEGQQPSVPSGITEERVSELLDEKLASFSDAQKELLEQLAEREVQSKHDRRYGRFETKLDELLNIKSRVEEADGNWDDILAQIERAEATQNLESALDAKIQEALTSIQPAPDEAGRTAQRKAEWEMEWAQAVQNIQDRATKDELEIPADALAQVQSGRYDTKIDAYTALNDLYIAIRTGAEIPVAAALPEGGGGTPPPSNDVTPPTSENYDAVMKALQDAIRTKGAGSDAARAAKAEVDKLLATSYEEHDIKYKPQDPNVKYYQGA